jgi:copper chaperone CopZ
MSKYIKFFILFILFTSKSFSQIAASPHKNPVELGRVKWIRSYSEAISQSKDLQLPIFILFQEVPGCQNCTKYGNTLLSHPLVVEALETCFVPLCIYNNQGGADAEVLKKYNEQSWNNPVVRIVDCLGKDLVPRQPDFNQHSKTIQSMINGLNAIKKDVPLYLELLNKEWSASKDEAYLSMYCFWSGEREIANINGVINTEAGYMHGKEVVKVSYDKSRVNINDIAKKAKALGCADEIYGSIAQGKVNKPVGSYRKDAEDKYYLSKSLYKAIPMTEIQKTLVNSALGNKTNPDKYLSPRQISILSHPKFSKFDHRTSDITKVWYL